ncbi:MAG: CPBP family intramembrane metalloprotease [Clostridia bacterium]|nr:CPBP family intramembrane metalloprotease [Clostridia bacterium]
MQSADFEEDLYKNWFRRPTLFVACAWFLLATAGLAVLRLGLSELALLLRQARLRDIRGWTGPAADTLYQLGVLAFPAAWYAARHPGVEQAMRLRAPHPLVAAHAVVLGAAGVALSMCLSAWWTLLIESAGGAPQGGTAAPSTPAGLAQALLVSALLPAVCEELMFRGGIMGAWERRGSNRALAVSSLMFAALHGSVEGLPVQLVMGFALGYVSLRSGSLWACAIVHASFNAGALVLSYLLNGRAIVNIYAIMASGEALGLFVADTVASTALFALMLVWLKRVCERLKLGGPQLSQPDGAPLGPPELVVLTAGILTAAIRYMEDILAICGVL